MYSTEQNPIHPTPTDCFTLAELEIFQSFAGQALSDVNYYLWLNETGADAAPYRFLYFLELIFEGSGALLLSSGEDSTAIHVGGAETLVATAEQLRSLHGKIGIQRLVATHFALWQPAVGLFLEGINLTRNEEGLYLNDALQLDFGDQKIVVQLAQKEGLELVAQQGIK